VVSEQAYDVVVMGLGYIGLPTASLLATKGMRVLGVDVKESVVATINEGAIHIVEPDLDVLVRSAVNSGNLSASMDPVSADIFILAVPTPFKDGHLPDTSFIEAATARIAPVLNAGDLVILESTSPVGTTERVAAILSELRPDLVNAGERQFAVAHCPERVLPGRILLELVENDRIVGGVDVASTERAVAFYERFVRGEVIATEARTAELAKLSENSFRDVNIGFANELSMICQELDINVWEVIRLANRHPRVDILRPGPGVGGHCLAVDPWFIVASAPERARLIRTAREVNDCKTDWVFDHVAELAGKFRRPVIACLGVTYKPDIDDLRESPALRIAQRLTGELKDRAEVLSVDPNVEDAFAVDIVPLEEALGKADVVVALVAHREFRRIDTERLKEKIVIDTCGVFP
jgi:UDP-N-acetyl-D-mannosaminuronic acid dehydrogenase